MKKTSAFTSKSNKRLVTEKLTNYSISTKYDDNFSINGESLIINPQIDWLVKSNIKLDSLQTIFEVVNGKNYHSKVNFILANKGYYINDEMINYGAYPINFKMVGANRSFKVSKKNELPFIVGNYNVSTSLFRRNIFSGTTIQGSSTLAPSFLSEPTYLDSQTMIDRINNTDPSNFDITTQQPRSGSYSMFISEVYDVKTLDRWLVISSTPIYLSQSKLSYSTDVQVFIEKPTSQNKNMLWKFYLVTTSRTWILKIDQSINLSDLVWISRCDNFNYIQNSGSNLVECANKCGIQTSKIGFSQVDPTTGNTVVQGYGSISFGNRFTIGYVITDVTSENFHHLMDTINLGDNIPTLIPQSSKFYSILNNSYLRYYDKVASIDGQYFISFHSWNVMEDPSTGTVFEAYSREGNIIINEDGSFSQMSLSQVKTFLKNSPYVCPMLWFKNVNDNNISKVNIDDKPTWLTFDNIIFRPQRNINVRFRNVTNYIYKESDVINTLDRSLSLPLNSISDYYDYVAFDIEYDIEEEPGLLSIPVSSDHYSSVRVTNDDVVLSDDIDELIGLNNVPQDYFYSKLLETSTSTVDAINQSNKESNQVSLKDKINQAINDNQDATPQDKLLVQGTIVNKIDESKLSITDGSLNEQSQIDQYLSFKQILLAKNSPDDANFSIIGQARVLAVNPLESKMYSYMNEVGMDEDDVKAYANNIKLEFDSMLGQDSFALVDAVDMMNEINIINSLVADQTSNLSNAINKVLDTINNSGNDIASIGESVNDQMTSIFTMATNMSDSIAVSTNELIKRKEEISSLKPDSYDSLLFSRNVDKATNYAKNFSVALLSDPLLALKQHVAYLRSRAEKISLKSSILNGVIKGLEFIPKIPSLALNLAVGIGELILLVGSVALKGAVEAITVIDNIDKLIFISEQYLSKGIVDYSSIPTVYDDMFTPPYIQPQAYDFIKRKAQVEVDVGLSLNNLVQIELNKTKTNPIIVDGVEFKYNDYDIRDVETNNMGFYYPKHQSSNYPIIKPINETTSLVLPDLTDFIPTYPQRGMLWKTFLGQIQSMVNDDSLISSNQVDSLSPYIPVSPEVQGAYAGYIIGLTLIAAASASVSAMIRGDWIGAIAGAASAATVVATANGLEATRIVERRTKLSENDSVYTYFTNNYNQFKEWLTNAISRDNFIHDNFIFVKTVEDTPLYSDASELKKFFLQVKEALFLVSNLVLMASASILIGNVASKISRMVKNKIFRKSIKKAHKRERALLVKEKDKAAKAIDDQILATQNDQTLSQDEKNKRIKELRAEKSNLEDWLQGKQNLLPVTKERLNGFLASNYGFGPTVTSSSGPDITNLAGIGPLTSAALTPFIDKYNKFFNSLSESEKQDQSSDSDNASLTNLLGASSELMKTLFSIKNDTNEIKKFT